MGESDRDCSFSTTSSSNDQIDNLLKRADFESSLDSYSNVFDKNHHNFINSSEISFVNLDDEDEEDEDQNALVSTDHNRTFTKERSKAIINAFTGKPISPNPWRKLCTKNVPQPTDTDVFAPIPLCSPDLEVDPSNQITTHQSRRDTSDEDDRAFEQFLQEHRTPTVIKPQQNTPIQRRRKKRNSSEDLLKNSSSSNENIPDSLLDHPLKTERTLENISSWHRLADVYTSEESDEKYHPLPSNTNLTIRMKSEIYTSDHSSTSSSSSIKTDPLVASEEIDGKSPLNFLQSLSDCTPITDKHPDAKLYFLQSNFKLKNKRQELADQLLSVFNRDVFSSQLSDRVSVVWSGRLTATAGHCTTRKATCTAVITLSHKVCDSPERCRDTLLHEMCHAAVTLIDGVMEHGHGPLWRRWTRIAEQCYPYLPPISIRHTYDVLYKFIYRCIQCQYEVYRHSKSLNLQVDLCGKCMGQFELIVNPLKNEEEGQQQTPKKAVNKYNLYVKENYQLVKQANPHLSTPQLMKQLSHEYKKKKEQQQETTDLPDLGQLKI